MLGKTIDVGILADGDLIIKAIGEELIRENHKDINFYFLKDLVSNEADFIILNHNNREKMANDNFIYLCESVNESGIFLFQGKAKIKKEILNIIGKENLKDEFEVVSGISPFNLVGATLFNQFIARELAVEGFKVCLISLNITFPFKYFGWNMENKGLLKAIYYYQNNDDFNPGIISQHESDNYSFIEMDIKVNESNSISKDFIQKLLSFLKGQNYKYIVLDYGIFHWQFPNCSDNIFYLQNKNNSLLEEMDKNYLENLNKVNSKVNLEFIRIESLENIFTIKNEKIRFNKEMEDLDNWKKSLKKILLKN